MVGQVRVSAADRATYARDGAVLLKHALEPEEVDLLARGVEESYADPGKRFSRARSPEGKGETFLETFPCLRSPSLGALLARGRVPQIAARMIGAPALALALDQVFYKKAGHVNATPWHQDTPFLRVRGDDLVRVWICADPSPRAITLRMVRGSHRWGVVFAPRTAQTDGKAIEQTGEGRMFSEKAGFVEDRPVMPDIAAHPDSFDILEWDVEPGDALVFNGNMLHGSGGMDNSPDDRRAYATLWAGPETRYFRGDGSSIPTLADAAGAKLAHGDRIGDRLDAFPIRWTESASA